MRSMSRIFLGALFAVSLSGLAYADSHDSNSSVQPGEVTLTAQLDLDRQFERSLDGAADARFQRMAGPTQMTCAHALTTSELDTCVVTAQGTPRAAVPAAIASH